MAGQAVNINVTETESNSSRCAHFAVVNVTFDAPTESTCTERRMCMGQVLRIELTGDASLDIDFPDMDFTFTAGSL